MLTAMGALVLGLLSARRDNQALEAKSSVLKKENARLRIELGELTIYDQQKIYAIRMPGSPPNTYAYRVYLPSGDTYQVGFPIDGVPGNVVKGLKPGKHLFSFSFLEQPKSWPWKFTMKRLTEDVPERAGSAGGSVDKKDLDFAKWIFSVRGVGEETQIETDLRKKLVLMDLRGTMNIVDSAGYSKALKRRDPNLLSSGTINDSITGLLWIDRASNRQSNVSE